MSVVASGVVLSLALQLLPAGWRVPALLAGATAFAVDSAGNLTTQTRPSGHADSYGYDLAGRLTSATNALGYTASYGYDAAGALTRVTLPRGGQYSFGYDVAGRLATQTDPLGNVTSFGYDGQGRLSEMAYPSGRVVSATYDDAGRLTTVAAGGVARGYGYDAAGRLTSAGLSGEVGPPALGFEYNDLGLLVQSTDALGVTSYGYDVAQRLVSRAPPTGVATTYAYNNRSLVSQVRGPYNVDLTYASHDGRLTRIDGASPSKAYETRSHDAAGRLTQMSTYGYSPNLTYTVDGQIATITLGTKVTSYDYDEAGRLTSAVMAQSGNPVSSRDYTWDADGNRTSVAVDGQPAVSATYDLADRMLSTSDGASYGYDDDGRLTSQGPTSYGYDAFGELASATFDQTTIQYGRDALGQPATRTTDTTAETFGHDPLSGALAATRAESGPVTNLLRLPGGRLLGAAKDGATPRAFGVNVHGDVSTERNHGSSTIQWTAEYDPFGQVTATRPVGRPAT